MAGPSTDGNYKVAMISKTLPDNPPQESIHTFHPESSIYGSVSLARPKDVQGSMMKPWKDNKTGNAATPVNPANLEKMKDLMSMSFLGRFFPSYGNLDFVEPHINWNPAASPTLQPSTKK
jgi:hypothetical protein